MLTYRAPTIKAKKPAQRLFVDNPSPVEEWSILHRIADLGYPLFRDLFLDTFGNLRDGLDIEKLMGALFIQSPSAVDYYIDVVWRDFGAEYLAPTLKTAITTLVADAATATIPFTKEFAETHTVPGGIADISFNINNPRTQTYIDNYVASRVTGVGDSTKEAIKGIVSRGFSEGRTVDSMARDIREFIGLLPRDVTALEKYRAQLVKKKVFPSVIKRRLESRRNKYIRRRARMIARTETITSAAAGQHQLWQQAASQGWLSTTRTRRKWIVTPDNRNDDCNICPPVPGLNPDGVMLDQPFTTPVGPHFHPTLHPSCRCAVILFFIED